MVGNRAVCYNENLEYCLVRSNGAHYIVAADLLSTLGVQSFFSDGYEVGTVVRGSQLASVQYNRPLSDTCH